MRPLTGRPRPPRLPGAGRVEAFSDAVFAIVLTILVLDLLPGDRPRSPADLLAAWPQYLAYLTAFLTVGAIWLTHHAVFSRVERTDAVTSVLNLVILLGTSLAPWPTALISVALADGDHDAQVGAIVVYAVVTGLVSVGIWTEAAHLARHPELLAAPDDAVWLRRHSARSLATIPIGVIGVVLSFVSPLAALVLYLLVPAGFVALTLRDGGSVADAGDRRRLR